ncbi:hypothetical protein C8Q77DRAFT_930624 [Trametes polyzona]|nr:hypothetical protein C8Q77DRAFT_930624 [Trametes polyzona]
MFSSSSAALVGFPSPLSLRILFAAGLAALALAPAPAAARFASISFSDVKQCGSFTVDFVGGQAPAALPLTLSLLPLNGTPFFITLPANAWNATTQTGAAIAFLPFPAGTEFIASLDDADGQGTALVSDVLVVDPSDSDDTSCLPTGTTPVRFDPSQGRASPSIRAFTPRGASFPVNQSAPFDDASGIANYTMDAERDTQVIFLFKDGDYAETSARLPVFGDIQSSDACIPTNPLANAAMLESTGSSTHVTPKIAVIVIAVCGGVVAIVAMAMVAWCVVHRRKTRAEKFTKLAEAQSPTERDPEKLQPPQRLPFDTRRVSPPPRIITSVNTSPISPVDPRYDELTRYLRNPPYTSMTLGSSLRTPTSPDPKDPFGEQQTGSLLGPLSARESLSAKDALGATALGQNGSTLTLPNVREADSVAYSAAARSSTFDPSTERMPGTSPYFGRLAITPDNSLASTSVLRRPASSQTSTTVSSQEIDHILEMATIYGVSATELPDLPRPAVTAPATLRSSAYMAGRESRRESGVLSPSPRQSPVSLSGRGSPRTFSPTHSRSGSRALSHSTSQSTLRLNRFREPPLAPLPSSPLPSPNARPSFDVDGVAVRDSSSAAAALRVPISSLQPTMLNRNTSSATRESVYSNTDEDGLEGFAMLNPPPRAVQR